jgi:hypothetical protein
MVLVHAETMKCTVYENYMVKELMKCDRRSIEKDAHL